MNDVKTTKAILALSILKFNEVKREMIKNK